MQEETDWQALEAAALDVINEVVRHPLDPPVLYHYTTPEPARQIIETGHIWASNIRYMNDLSELRHAYDVVAKVLKDVLADLPTRVGQMVDIVSKSLEKFIHANNFYVASFSGHPDLLGQWRAYCAAGRGFALGFEGRAISGFAGQFNLFRVEYARPDQELAVRRIFDLYRPVLLHSAEAGETALARAATQFGIPLVLMLLAFKHEAFADEREYRLFRSNMLPVPRDQIHFRGTDRTIVPYMTIDLASHDRNVSGKAPLQRVIIGPCLDAALAEKSLRMLFDKFGYGAVDVVRSEVPLAT
ncbi:MAG TPA: DUF2971 domain-containing protein [Thermoanaerobaculia bacterium]|nr:DUF2971 domain-containing protein [Thermoanaerobaculia bacterium]